MRSWLSVLLLTVSLLPGLAWGQDACPPTTITTPSATLAWQPQPVPPGASSVRYVLEQQRNATPWATLPAPPATATAQVIADLEHGQTYAWRLSVQTLWPSGSLSTSPPATPGTPPPCVTVDLPVPPTDETTPPPLSATYAAPVMTLTWAGAEGEREVFLQRCLLPECKWTRLATVFGLQYNDRGVKAGQEACYRSSWYDATPRVWSARVCASAAPAPRQARPLVVTPLAAPLPLPVALGWEAPTEGGRPASYHVYRRTGTCPMAATLLPQGQLRVVAVDSEETAAVPTPATNAVDGQLPTYWHTAWGERDVPPPHWMILDLGAPVAVSGWRYVPRQDGGKNGTIGDYQVFVSGSPTAWGVPVASGTFAPPPKVQDVGFPPVLGRYVKLVATREMYDRPWTSAAEMGIRVQDLPGGPWLLHATVPGTVLHWNGSSAPETACWQVTASSAEGTESPASNQVAWPPDQTPTGFRLVLP